LGVLGHVGLPLGIVMANAGQRVCLLDIDPEKRDLVLAGRMPFVEHGAGEILRKVLADGRLSATIDPQVLREAPIVIIALGTPVDEFMSPQTRQFLEIIVKNRPYLSRNQLLVIRSTVYPRTINHMMRTLGTDEGDWNIPYCP
ncbi:MAG: nucleotide sugar dehydrogenase, partial [Planctomycetes bacterium]|nr:nucleotide sugar dehydrogenase [Planctomycetota bacterium]